MIVHDRLSGETTRLFSQLFVIFHELLPMTMIVQGITAIVKLQTYHDLLIEIMIVCEQLGSDHEQLHLFVVVSK